MLPGPDPEKNPETADPNPPPPRPQQRRPPPGNRPPPPRRPLPPRPQPPKRRHHRGKAGRARVGLAVMFVFFRLVDFLWVNSMPTDLHRLGYAVIILTALWTTPLLFAVFQRKSWARLLFLGMLAVIVIASFVGISPVLEYYPDLFTFLLLTTATYAVSFFWLLYSRDVHRLTGHSQE